MEKKKIQKKIEQKEKQKQKIEQTVQRKKVHVVKTPNGANPQENENDIVEESGTNEISL